jgi:hypothetical protein
MTLKTALQKKTWELQVEKCFLVGTGKHSTWERLSTKLIRISWWTQVRATIWSALKLIAPKVNKIRFQVSVTCKCYNTRDFWRIIRILLTISLANLIYFTAIKHLITTRFKIFLSKNKILKLLLTKKIIIKTLIKNEDIILIILNI